MVRGMVLQVMVKIIPDDDSTEDPITQSDQSLCLWRSWVAKDLSFLHADNEDSDQTVRMPKLRDTKPIIFVTKPIVGFVTQGTLL